MERYKLYREVVDNAYDGIYFVDKDRKILLWNKAAEKITGYGQEEVVGKHCYDNILVHVDKNGVSLCQGSCPLAATIKDGQIREAEFFLHHKRGHRVPVLIRAVPMRNEKDEIIGAVEIFSDATGALVTRQRLQELERLAMLDPLTELPNRRYLEHELETRLAELKRYGWPFGLMFLDLDHFKKINDEHGHDAGDMALKMVARNILHNIRSSDVIGRWAGDEFLGVLRNVDAATLKDLAERYRMLIKNSDIPAGALTLKTAVSIGVTMARKEDTAATLLERADKIMYAGKEAGRDCVFGDEVL